MPIEDTYPTYSEQIRAARADGFSDEEIQREFQSFIQEQSRSGQSVQRIQQGLGQERPGLLQRLASGGAGDVAQSSLEALAYPVEVAAGGIGGMIAGVARPAAAGLANLVAAATNSDPRALERKALSAVDEASPYIAYQPQGQLARTTLEVALAPFTAAEKGLEAAGVPEEIAKPAVEVGGLVLPFLYHRFKGRAPRSPAEVEQFARQEPAAVEALKRVEETAPKDLASRIEAAKRDGFTDQEIAQELVDAPSKPVPKQEVSVEPSAKGPEFFGTLRELGYTDEQLRTMPFAEKVRRARERVPAEEPRPVEEPLPAEELTRATEEPIRPAVEEPVNAPETKTAPIEDVLPETPKNAPEATITPKVADEVVPPVETQVAPKGERPAPEVEAPPSAESATSIKNAVVDKELADMGLPPATHGQRMSFEEARAAAAQAIEKDPLAGQKLVDELAAKPRPATATEDAILLHEQTRLKNERVAAENQLIEAQKSGDPAAITEAKRRVEDVTTSFKTIGDVVTQVGTESSLSLGHRRMMMKEDFSLAAMERAKQIAQDGKPLTDAERAEVKTLHEKIVATQKAFDEYSGKVEAQRAEAESKLAHTRLVIETAKSPTVEPQVKSLVDRVVIAMENEANAARIRIRQKAGRLSAGVDPTLIADMAIVGAAKIARGTLEFGRWSKAMIEDLGQGIEPFLQAAWDASNKRLDEFVTRRVPKSSQERVARVLKKEGVVEQREAIKEQIRARVESGEGNDIGGLAQRLARGFIEQGVKERGALIDAVHGELKGILPEMTRRDAMDAISGYGKFKQLSKDEISVELRDLKGQMQQVAKLEDIEAKKPPLKTGVEQRAPSNEERRLIQAVNEAKRRFGIVVTDPVRQLQTALGAVKTRLKNNIADLEYQIASGEKIVREKTGVPYDAEALELKARQTALREEFNQIFGKPEMTDAQRVKLATAAVERSIADLEQRIKTGDIGPRTRASKTPATPELEALRARREDLQGQLDELRDLANPKKTPEQISLQTLKTRLKNNTAKLQERLARGDFADRPRREVKLDAEGDRLQFEAAQVKRRWNEALMQDRLANRTTPQKILGGAGEVLNTSRALLTSLDLSAVLRQGGFVSLGHPVRAAKALPDMFRSLSKAGEHKVMQEIQSRPNYPLYKRSKLYLSERAQTLSQMEEAYMSRWAEKIPLVGASQRAYTTFLNRLRADSFDAMAKSLGRDGEVTAPEANAIANFINVATGRGNLGMKENALVGLNSVIFAPRYVASRFQLLAGQPLYRGTTRTRTMIAKEYARYLTGVGVVYALAQASGAEVEIDPRSSDFGKLRFGNTRMDPMSGLLQVSTLLGRLATGETKRIGTGNIVPIRGEKVPFGGDDSADVLARFLRTKLAPIPGTAVDILSGKNVVGEKVTPQSVAANVAVPLAFRDIYDAMIDQGVPQGTALGILSIFGMGLQTFEPKKK